MENSEELKHESIDNLISNGYKLRIWHYIENGFKLYRKNFWGFVGFTAIIFVVVLGITLLIRIPIGISKISGGRFNSGNTPLMFLVSTLTTGLTAFIITNGYFIVGSKILHQENYSFDNFFDGFKLWKKLISAYLVVFIISSVFIYLPFMDFFFGLIKHFTPYQDEKLSQMFSSYITINNVWISGLLLIIGIYLNIAFKWIQMFIVFSGMKPIKAIMTSIRIITKRWFSFTAFYIIIYIIILLPLFIVIPISIFILSFNRSGGHLHHILYFIVFEIAIFFIVMVIVLFLTPILYLSLYASFEDVVGTERHDKIAEENPGSLMD